MASGSDCSPRDNAVSHCECGGPSSPCVKSSEPLSLLPVIVLVLLPKCPLCLAAWFGILGSFGASAWLRAVWGAPLAAGLLSFVIAALALQARVRRVWWPLLAGTLGAAALLTGRYFLNLPILFFVGLALLTLASFWGTSARFDAKLQKPTGDAPA